MIRGYTFDYQEVDAKADARLMRSLFSNQDGRLAGGEVSIAGLAGLRIDVCDFLMCGRHIALDEPIIAPTTQLQSGATHARVKVVLDLSITPANEFTQCQIVVEGAESKNGFIELVKQDINHDGTKYELEIALLALDSTRHISEVIRFWELITPSKSSISALTNSFAQSRLEVNTLSNTVANITTSLNTKADVTDIHALQSTIAQIQAQINTLLNE